MHPCSENAMSENVGFCDGSETATLLVDMMCTIARDPCRCHVPRSMIGGIAARASGRIESADDSVFITASPSFIRRISVERTPPPPDVVMLYVPTNEFAGDDAASAADAQSVSPAAAIVRAKSDGRIGVDLLADEGSGCTEYAASPTRYCRYERSTDEKRLTIPAVKSGDVERVRVVDHPAVADRLARVRDAETRPPVFRRLVEELGTFLAYEATRGLAVREAEVVTPLERARVARIARRPVVAPILRAGLGLLPGFLAVIDEAVVAHLGFFRDPQTLEAVPYYANLPDRLAGDPVFALDPMLATGHSSAAAFDVLAERGATEIALLCLIAAPAGIAHLLERHPSARVVTCAIDERLTDHGYIAPGLGDAGDRMFGSATSVPASYRRSR